uniref:Uncharacterized protein n=1 Tax=Spongospora subterranea TaxID=70186 RepID=A0A0H5R721_9EUKA|eukprot:CRZ09913.1 hypothetical protein [Spongospora subterranea]
MIGCKTVIAIVIIHLGLSSISSDDGSSSELIIDEPLWNSMAGNSCQDNTSELALSFHEWSLAELSHSGDDETVCDSKPLWCQFEEEPFRFSISSDWEVSQLDSSEQDRMGDNIFGLHRRGEPDVDTTFSFKPDPDVIDVPDVVRRLPPQEEIAAMMLRLFGPDEDDGSTTPLPDSSDDQGMGEIVQGNPSTPLSDDSDDQKAMYSGKRGVVSDNCVDGSFPPSLKRKRFLYMLSTVPV